MSQAHPHEFTGTNVERLSMQIRETFGPLHLVELNSDRWAIVRQEWLSDEEIAAFILSEDAEWFNVEPDRSGRSNPTYADKVGAIRGIKEMLSEMNKRTPDGSLSAAIKAALIYARDEHPVALAPPMRGDVMHGDESAGDADSALHEPPTCYVEDGVTEEQGIANKTPPEAVKSVPAASGPFPWSDLAGIKETNLLYKMPPEVVAKMLWIMENVPKMSKQRLVRDGTNMLIDALIEKHYKP